MDHRTAGMVAEMYESKLFSATEVGRHFGVSRQLVRAVTSKMLSKRRRERSMAFFEKHGLDGPVPDHLRKEYYLATAPLEELGGLVMENPVDP